MSRTIKEKTIKQLFALSRNKCTFKNCYEKMVNDQNIVVGEICHIEAKNSKEKRFNPEQGDDDNRSFDNLILLCRNHHIEIDNNINTYTVEYLKQIKKDHLENKEQDKRSFSEEELKIIFEQYNIAYYKKNPISIIPNYDIKKLIGRTDMLDKLHKMLTENKSAILMNGIGGIGKTTVALAYCNTEKYKQDYQNIVWVTLTQSLKESIINTFIDKDIDFKYDEKEDTDKNFNHLLNTLRNIIGNNLLVLDNANNDKEIIENKQSLEDTNWKILLTTRCLLDDEYTIKVDKLSEEDAVKVFLQYCKVEDMETLKKLLKHIDYHTLLTELLAKTLKRSPLLDINKLYEIIKSQDISAPRIKKEIPIGSHAEYSKAAKKEEELYTYILNIFELENMSEKENEYLRYFSILPSVEIPIIDLYKFFGITEEKEIEFEDTLNSLVQKGWIQENNKTYKMHQIIQTVIREKLQPNAENCKDIIIYIGNLLSYKLVENPFTRNEIVPFAENIWNSIYDEKNEQNILTKNLAALSNNLAELYRYIGSYYKSLKYHEKSITITVKVLSPDHPALATSYNNIALTYKALGNFEKALEYQKKSITIREKVLEPDHPDLATSYGNIALTYIDLGKYEKALEYSKKSISTSLKILVPDHLSLAFSYNTIAITYIYLGNYEKSLEYQEKSITIREKVLGPDHPSLATSYDNIAKIYRKLGDFNRALEYQKNAIIMNEKILEPDHPYLATSYNNIALIYLSLGNYVKAVEFNLRCIEIHEKILDNNHPWLATSYNNIAETYRELNKYEKSLEFHNKAIKIRVEVLEKNHPDFAQSYCNIATTYYDMKDYKQAKYYIDKSVEIRKNALPEDHPHLIRSLEWQKIINDALNNQ